MPTILTIETPTLGDRSYLVHDGTHAFVVDPQRDIDRVLAVAAREGVRITDIFETHIHNDYVTGGFALAQQTGAAYHVGADDPVSFERVPIRDGEVVRVGESMVVRALLTPGHTFTHLSYVLEGDPPRSSPVAPSSSARRGGPTSWEPTTPRNWRACSTPPPTGWRNSRTRRP